MCRRGPPRDRRRGLGEDDASDRFVGVARRCDRRVPASALEVWRYPDGSNPLEALFAGPSPIPFITGELTGVWFGDLFAYMNLTLLLVLLAASSKSLEEKPEDE